jgi:membrane complex biogenesis BtpA family protein
METKENKFRTLFGNTPIIGMIHLAGQRPVERALEEIAIFEEAGVDAALVENYHSGTAYVTETLKAISKRKNKVIVGVNILLNEFEEAFSWADKFGAKFIQLDYVAGKYGKGGCVTELDYGKYADKRKEFPNIAVLGGVWPKYYPPVKGSVLEEDLKQGMERADALVVTGKGTGKETPISKIRKFRETCGKEYPVIVGAGLNAENAYEQLMIADGAIVGSYFKHNNETNLYVERARVKQLMNIVKEVRLEKTRKNGA